MSGPIEDRIKEFEKLLLHYLDQGLSRREARNRAYREVEEKDNLKKGE